MSRLALVVLVACSSTPHERAPAIPTAPADAAVDAQVDAAIDAATARAVPKENLPMMQCREVMGPSNRFPMCREDGKVVELARPIDLAILRHGASTDQGTPVVVGGGTQLGITNAWRATLLDAKQREMDDATFIRLDRDQIEVLAPMAGERIDNFARSVRFTPPEGARLVIPPGPVVLRVVRYGPQTAKGTRLLLGGGFKRGIAKTWRIDVLDGTSGSLAVASFVRLDPDEIEIVVRLTLDQARARATSVRFTPP